MHMADALVSPAFAGTMYAVSAAAAGYSIYKVKKRMMHQRFLLWESWEHSYLQHR